MPLSIVTEGESGHTALLRIQPRVETGFVQGNKGFRGDIGGTGDVCVCLVRDLLNRQVAFGRAARDGKEVHLSALGEDQGEVITTGLRLKMRPAGLMQGETVLS